MARKLLGSLSARVVHGEDGALSVVIEARKTTPAFQNTKAQDPFRSIRVFRSTEDSFEFGNDYEEFFDGISTEKAEVVFEGPIEADNDRTFAFADRDVEIGSTYCYWMSGGSSTPTGPVAVRVRDPRVWWPYRNVPHRIAQLEQEYPNLVRSEIIGRTVRGRPIHAIRAGARNPSIAVVGAVHAGEAGPELSLGTLGLLLDEAPSLLEQIGVSLIPSLNADEREREVSGTPWYLRTNAAGVDLNRNFPADWEKVERGYGLDSSDPTSVTYRGAVAGSEPETQATIAALETWKPAAVFAYHCLASICGMGFITARDAETDRAYGERCTELAAAYIGGSGIAVPKDKTCRFVCTAGSLPAWCWRVLGVPGFDLEISAEAEPEAYAACRVDLTDFAMVEKYQRFHADGMRKVLEHLVQG